MQVRAILSTLVLCTLAGVLASCAKNPTAPVTPPGNEQNPPAGFPPIPYPPDVQTDTPDSSEIYTAIVPIAGNGVDFAPVWETGRFTWDIDIQTQYERCLPNCRWFGDAPGDYWSGTRNSTALLFEGGTVDLRNPDPMVDPVAGPYPKRVQFVQHGNVLATPINPEQSKVTFQFSDAGYTAVVHDGALFGGTVEKPVDPAIGETERRRVYYVAATACAPLTNPVYIRRERYWKRIPLVTQGGTLMSVAIDPGATFEVSYTWSAGVNIDHSKTFTRSVNGAVSLGTEKSVVGAKLGGALSQAFTSDVQVTEENSVTVTKTLSGIPDKTTVYAAWITVERYTIVDRFGNPYTDPNFTFNDLGTAVIAGNREQIASKSFPHQQ